MIHKLLPGYSASVKEGWFTVGFSHRGALPQGHSPHATSLYRIVPLAQPLGFVVLQPIKYKYKYKYKTKQN